MPKQMLIDPLSVVPLFLECLAAGIVIGSGTGFIIEKGGRAFLVTNWHVLSGRDPTTNELLSKKGAVPDTLAVWHHIKGPLGTWGRRLVPLMKSDGSPGWLEHPQGERIDVAALPVTLDAEVQLYPLDISLADTDLIVWPAEPVSILGFPFGFASAGRFPIWKTGHIASDIDLDYNGLPVFLIDATTRPGMSGSPVIARRIGMWQSSQAMNVGGGATRFLGVYSGRIHEQADIGMVWRPEVLNSIVK